MDYKAVFVIDQHTRLINLVCNTLSREWSTPFVQGRGCQRRFLEICLDTFYFTSIKTRSFFKKDNAGFFIAYDYGPRLDLLEARLGGDHFEIMAFEFDDFKNITLDVVTQRAVSDHETVLRALTSLSGDLATVISNIKQENHGSLVCHS